MVKLIKFKNINKEELDKIINKYYTHWKQIKKALDFEKTVNNLKNQLTQEEGLPIGYACHSDDNFLGFCTLKKYQEIYLWSSSVMIFDEYRHRGYGTRMLQEVVKKAKEKGYPWTNQIPKFYKKIGLQKVKKTKMDTENYFIKRLNNAKM